MAEGWGRGMDLLGFRSTGVLGSGCSPLYQQSLIGIIVPLV